MSDDIGRRMRAAFAAPEQADWPDVARRAARRRRRPRLVVALVAVLAVALAAPALGVDVEVLSFREAERAPVSSPIVQAFGSLDRRAPVGLAPGVRAEEARTIEVGDRTLHLAPTRGGGFCFGFLGRFGTCALDRKRPIGVAFIASDPVELGGHVLAEPGAKLELTRADGSRQQIEVTWVSEPIDAGLFYTEVAREPRILALELRSAAGTVLGRHTRFEPLYDRRENPSEIDATGIPQGAVAEEKRRLLSSGDAALWVAPQRGGGSCWWLTFRARTYGSNCPPPEFEARHRPLPIEAGINIERIYNGRVGPGVAQLELRFDDGSVETVRSREGFVLYEFGTHRHPVLAIARDELGDELGRHHYRPPRG